VKQSSLSISNKTKYPKENDYYCKNIRERLLGFVRAMNEIEKIRNHEQRKEIGFYRNYNAIIDPRLPFLIASIKAIMRVVPVTRRLKKMNGLRISIAADHSSASQRIGVIQSTS